MKQKTQLLLVFCALLMSVLVILPNCTYAPPYMKMNPPADSNKPLPVPASDNSCYLHTAANLLAAAGYGTGTTVQLRADDIWADFSNAYGPNGGTGGWIDAALQWWLGSTNNTWSTNPYTLPTVVGNKPQKIPWADANGAQRIANELRSCNMVGLSISWPTVQGGAGGHAITSWGDTSTSVTALTTNPAGVRVTDSDTNSGGNVQAYTYDAYTSPNPGGVNIGNGWYFNYSTPHPFIKHICILGLGSGKNSVMVTGSYKIHQANEQQASDLHYRVGTDVDILTYKTWLDWEGTPTITESQPRRELTVDWNLSQKPVPYCTWVTINTEFVEPSWNYISYKDVHFTYPVTPIPSYHPVAVPVLPDLTWNMETPFIEHAEKIPNVTGGYVIGNFDVYNPEKPSEPAVRYRFVHQYLYNQSPEFHTFMLRGTPGFEVKNLSFGHSYGYPSIKELWDFGKPPTMAANLPPTGTWMTQIEKTYPLSEEGMKIDIDWKGRLPYPEGDR